MSSDSVAEAMSSRMPTPENSIQWLTRLARGTCANMDTACWLLLLFPACWPPCCAAVVVVLAADDALEVEGAALLRVQTTVSDCCKDFRDTVHG